MISTLARITFLSFLFLLFSPHLASAETKTFIKEYTYQASEDDSRNSSRVTAMREVKRLLLEEVRKRSDTILEENKKLREELKLAKGEDKEKVQDKYNHAIKELSAIEWVESAYRNYQKGDLEAALHDFEKASELDPTYSQSYTTRGIYHAGQGKYNEAIVDFNKAIELNPRDVLAYYNRGKIYSLLIESHKIKS